MYRSMTTASPMTVMMPKGTSTIPIPAPSTDATGSCVEFRPVSLADVVVEERKVVLNVTFSGSVLGSAELVRTGMKVVMGSVGAGNGLRVWVEVNLSCLVVVRDMVLAGHWVSQVRFKENPREIQSSSGSRP